ncbi:MAG: SRPBCC family protein [Stellaceae bacterium]|jgi:uncharacterized protein YndB with AHSA1/START domain
MSSKFVYVTYIRTTPEKLWEALIKPEFTRSYWYGMRQDCDWQVGSSWQLVFSDNSVADAGKVLEIDRPRRLVLAWHNEFRPELKTEGDSRATFELEPNGDTVKLTVTHEMDRDGSKLIEAVSGGWPLVLSSLKSLLETGKALPGSDRRPTKA